MRGRTLVRFAVAAGAALLATFAAAGPAAADVVGVPINQGNVPTTAADFSTHECSANLGGGPFPGEDVWVFNLPDKTREFVSIAVNFDSDGDGVADKAFTIEAGAEDGDDIVNGNGTSKAWIRTPAGWTLTNATAVVTGDAPESGKPLEFVLTHTCPSSGTPSSSSSSGGTPSESSSSGGAGGGSSSSAAGGGGGGGLPTTGAKIGIMIGVGLALVAAGVGLVALRRRRDMVITP